MLAQAGNAGNQSLGGGNQPTTGGGAGNQPAGGGVAQTTWNDSTEPDASQIANLGPRANASQPFAVVGPQPTDPNNDSLYEDVNGDGRINIVDADALQRNLNSTAVGANWSAYDFTGDNRTDVGDVLWLFSITRGVAVNDSDGDGLPDAYERNWTNTDPTVADSDGDGVIDGAEDPDGDGLINYLEYRGGSDPTKADTDGDGFDDRREDRIAGISPVESDTDGDGVPDPADDLDGDNLSVENESVYNTSYRRPDTDGDGLQDGAEVHEYGTDPTVPDTDGDGIDDGDEIEAGMDPLSADSDGDGVADTNETVSVSTEHDATNVSLTLRANGSVANATIDEKPSYFPNSSAHAGPTVRIENQTTFENATVAIPVEESVSADEYENLSVYTWNGSVNDTWSKVDTTIENGTAKATVDHFSYFTVLHSERWVSATTIDGIAEPVTLAESNVSCSGACGIENESTLVLGGEPTNQKVRIEQGGETYEVTTMSNGESIETFYNYGNAQINSPLPIYKSDTTRLFVWSGTDGRSLVILNDHPSDGSGGTVSAYFDSLPASGGWAVQDDDPGNDEYRSQSAHWHWSDTKTDGAAWQGGLFNTSIEISMAFNGQAELDNYAGGTMSNLEVLTGQATQPEAISLDPDENVTVNFPGEPPEPDDANYTGDQGSAAFSKTLNESEDTVTVLYQTEQTDDAPEATFTARGENGHTVSKQLNIGTVGTVKQEVDVSELAGNNTTFDISASGVNMRTEVVTRGPEDTDGDGIRDSVEEQTWRMPNGDGSTFNLSATDADTDNDGLLDSEEVKFHRQVVDGELRVEPAYVRTNPEKADTDGDGLEDGRERNGWSITVLDSHYSAEEYVEAVSQNESNPDQYVTTRSVSSNPLQTDTDGDGVSDGRESVLGTDPNDPDTDNDGTGDNAELGDDTDPTLFDVRPPTVDVYGAGYASRTPDLSTINPWDDGGNLNFYYVNGYATDQGDVTSSTIIIDGDEYDTNGDPASIDREIDAGVIGGIEEGLTTTKIKIRVEDEHGNSRVVLAAARSNGLVEAVKQSGQLGRLTETQAFALGAGTGISGGAGQLAGTIQSVVTEPGETLDRFSNLDRYKSLITNADELPGLLVQSYRNQQRTANPYYRDGGVANEELYDDFRWGYYSGLVVFEVAASAAGGQVKKIDRVQDLASKARATRAFRYYRSARTTFVSGPASRVGSKITRSVVKRVDTDSAVVRRTMSGVETVGSSIQTARYVADTPNRVMRGLGERGRSKLRGYYRGIRGSDGGSGDPDLKAMTDGGQRNFQDALDDVRQGGRTAAELNRRLDTDEFQTVFDADIPDETRNSLLRAHRDGDMSASETARAARRLDGSDRSDVRQAIRDLDDAQQRRAYRLIGETGEDGVKFIDETSEADLKALFGQIESDPDLNSGDLARLVRSTDGKASELLDEISAGKYSDLLRLRGSNQRLTKEILIDGEINGKSRFVDSSVEGDEVVRIARNFERGRYEGPDGQTLDFDDVRVIGEQPNGNGMFMPKQSVDHAFERHVLADEIASKETTSLFPTGTVVRNSRVDSPAELPSSMSLSNRELRNEIKDLAFRTIRNENHDGGDAVYDGISRNGIEEVTINVDGSKVDSVYPTRGTSVRRWNNDAGRWEKWDGSNWVEWNNYSP